MEVAALFYSLVGSAKLVGIDPRRYLKAMAYAAIRGEEPWQTIWERSAA